MHNKKIKIWLPLLLSLSMIIGMYIGYKLKDNIKSPQHFLDMQPVNTLQEVVELISRKYADSINIDTLKTKAIHNILQQLDPYSAYIPANTVEELNNQLSGSFEGLGIEFQIIRDTANIVYVIHESPAAEAGLKVGDQLLAINNTPLTTFNTTPEKIKQQLQSATEPTIKLDIWRNAQRLQINITKGRVPVYTVDAAYKLDSITGYIRVNRFAENTYIEFMQALEKLLKQNSKQIVLDLRDNGGGLLTSAVDIVDELLNEDKRIVYIQGKNVPRVEYDCKRPGLFEKGKLVVLVNEGTASAAEVVAGALQDWDRATIIGRPTFGKGLVQEQYMLSDGEGLRLTTARYYLPTGRNIQKSYSNGKDTLNKQSFKTPAGHIVYGNNGIMPDVIIPADSIWNTPSTKALIEKNSINKFAYEHFIANRKTIETYKTLIDFAKQYTLPTIIWNDFLTYAKQNGVEINTSSSTLQIEILRRIKALLARFIWSNEGFYEVYNASDGIITKAVFFVNH